MKNKALGVTVILMGSIFFNSCSSENSVLSQFSKRKYLKNFKEQKHKETYEADEVFYTETKTPSSDLIEKTIEKQDNRETVEIENNVKKSTVTPIFTPKKNKEIKKTFAAWKKQETNMRLAEASVQPKTALELNKLTSKNNASSDVHPVVLVLLSIFLPPLAVYLYQDAIENDFWLDLILIIFLWVPSIIYALLVIFGGVSIN